MNYFISFCFIALVVIIIFAMCSPDAKEAEANRQKQIASLTEELERLQKEKLNSENQLTKEKSNQGWARNTLWFNNEKVSKLQKEVSGYDVTIKELNEQLVKVKTISPRIESGNSLFKICIVLGIIGGVIFCFKVLT